MRFWDIQCIFYRAQRALPGARDILIREIEALQKLCAGAGIKPEFVLDLGTGIGDTLNLIQTDFLIGMDRSMPMISKARRREGVIAVVGDGQQLPFKAKSAPFVAAIGLTEYLSHCELFLGEVGRVLKPGGCLLVTTARKRWINRLRRFLGHRLFLMDAHAGRVMLESTGYTIVNTSRTLLQDQYLVRKSSDI